MRIRNGPPDAEAARKRPFLLRAWHALLRLASDGEYRSLFFLRVRKPAGLFQLANDTYPDRFPALFQFARTVLGDAASLRLLSFGCSTGEEVFALRRYFPTAQLIGLDINAHNIARCRAKLSQTPDTAIVFAVASSAKNLRCESLDAIFCLSVLRSSALRSQERCDRHIRFEQFDACVTEFARCLKPGGILFILNSNFRLCDAAAYRQFEVIARDDYEHPIDATPIFGPDNKRLPGEIYCEIGFRKRAKP